MNFFGLFQPAEEFCVHCLTSPANQYQCFQFFLFMWLFWDLFSKCEIFAFFPYAKALQNCICLVQASFAVWGSTKKTWRKLSFRVEEYYPTQQTIFLAFFFFFLFKTGFHFIEMRNIHSSIAKTTHIQNIIGTMFTSISIHPNPTDT